MNHMETVGASYLSAYLGVSVTSIQNWRKEEGNDFPEPVTTVRTLFGARSVYGWRTEQIEEARQWYASRFHLEADKAAERWKEIDELLSSGQTRPNDRNISPGQMTFTIPESRTTAAA